MRSGLILAELGDATPATAENSTLPRVADAVADVVDDVVVTCPDGERSGVADALSDTEHRLAVDPVTDDGPVGAIRTGVRVATGSQVAVVAGDVPNVDAKLLEDLFEACETAAVPASGGRLHPLHAVYDAETVRVACDHTLASGSGRLYDVLSRVEPVVIDADAPDIDAHPLRSHADRSPATDRLGP